MRYLPFLALSILGCSTSYEPQPPVVFFVTGQEGDIWSEPPAATSIQVELVERDKRTPVGQATAPASELTIRDPGLPDGTIASFEATGIDPNGTVAVRGSTVPYMLFGLDGIDVPIFVGRTGTWSRPPSPFEHPHFRPVVAIAFHEYVLAAGGDPIAGKDGAVPDVYDMARWLTLRRQPPLPRAPKSMAVYGRFLLAVDDGGATWLNLNNDYSGNVSAPAGATFAEVAGGETFELDNGTLFIVGGTRRTGDPTAKVLRIEKDSTNSTNPLPVLSALSLSGARLGAAAAVIGGNLVVVGGSGDAPAVEILAKGETAFRPLSFPPNASTGHGILGLEGTTTLWAGGTDASGSPSRLRTFDAACAADCAITDIGTLPVALQRTKAFSSSPGSALVVGESEDGQLRTFSVVVAGGTASEITERPLREPRKWASALLLPNSQVGVLGGAKPDTDEPILSIETFVP